LGMAVIAPPLQPTSSHVRLGLKSGGRASLRQRKIESSRSKKTKTAWPVFLFLLALVVPWIIYVGPLRMSLYRIVLVVMVLPCLGRWIAGKAGSIRAADIALTLFWLWRALSFVSNNGLAAAMQPSGIVFVETLGPYMLARCYIRNADDFYNAVRLLFWIVVFLFPFAVVETVTGQNILRQLFGLIWLTDTEATEMRSGLTRARSIFDHAILFGLCTGSLFALVCLVLGYQKSFLQTALKSTIVVATSLCSLSAGPLIAVVTQGALLAWNGTLRSVKSRWKILIGLLGSLSLVVELVAKRSPIDIVVGYFTFDPFSYWYRMLEWEFGWRSVMNHPLLGVGVNDDWERPPEIFPSIDTFWLDVTVHSGLPAAFLMLLTFSSIFLGVGLKKGLDDKLIDYRTGFLITMMAFFLDGWTVAYWDHAYVFFLFLLGSGVWMADVETQEKVPRASHIG
jgi:hypothetical protein